MHRSKYNRYSITSSASNNDHTAIGDAIEQDNPNLGQAELRGHLSRSLAFSAECAPGFRAISKNDRAGPCGRCISSTSIQNARSV
jgi:hypothetical protein